MTSVLVYILTFIIYGEDPNFNKDSVKIILTTPCLQSSIDVVY